MVQDKPLTWLQHFEDLRRTLIVCLIALIVATVGCFFFSDFFLSLLRRPIDQMGLSLIFIGVTEGFFTKIKVALYAGFVVSFPVIAWQVWRFIVPALYPNERRYILTLTPISTLLFSAGVVFAYYTVFPVMMRFLLQISGELQPFITVSQYVSFCISFLIPFGIIFELPVFAMFLTRIGLITPQWLRSKRRYALLLFFIVGAVLTPSPDPVSQCLMALPMYILYEASIIISHFTQAKKLARQNEEEALDSDIEHKSLE